MLLLIINFAFKWRRLLVINMAAGQWPPYWIWPNRKQRRSIRLSGTSYPRAKQEVDRLVAEIWPFEIFPSATSVIGRSSVYILTLMSVAEG